MENEHSHQLLHYVEKPNSFVSTTISCGVYCFSLDLINIISNIIEEGKMHMIDYSKNYLNDWSCNSDSREQGMVSMEKDVFKIIADTKQVFVYHLNRQHSPGWWWSSIKTPGSAIFANRNYLHSYFLDGFQQWSLNSDQVDGESSMATIVGNNYIHPQAVIDPSAVV